VPLCVCQGAAWESESWERLCRGPGPPRRTTELNLSKGLGPYRSSSLSRVLKPKTKKPSSVTWAWLSTHETVCGPLPLSLLLKLWWTCQWVKTVWRCLWADLRHESLDHPALRTKPVARGFLSLFSSTNVPFEGRGAPQEDLFSEDGSISIGWNWCSEGESCTCDTHKMHSGAAIAAALKSRKQRGKHQDEYMTEMLDSFLEEVSPVLFRLTPVW